MAMVVGPDNEPDKYRLGRRLGGGGEAELWEAELDIGDAPERVAVKILRPEHVDDLDYWRGRWAAQVDLLRLVRHPGVVGVHAQFDGPQPHQPGAAAATPGGALYLVMNWVEGEDLRAWVANRPTPADRQAGLALLAQLAETLDYLHSDRATPSGRPIVHGDLSPGNVIVDPDGRAVLVDFGLVRIARHVTTTVGRGTAGYAAPEVALGGEYSPAADRYAFGAVAYHVLTGNRPPYNQAQLRAGLAEALAEAAPPAAVDDLLRIFYPDPAQRPGAGQWIQLLSAGLAAGPAVGLVARAPVPPAGSADATRDLTGAQTGGGRTGVAGRRRWWLPALLAVVVLVSLASGVLLGTTLLSGPSGGDPTEGPPAAAGPTSGSPEPIEEPSTNPPVEPDPSPWPGEPDGEEYDSGDDDILATDTYDEIAGSPEGLRAINGTVFFPWYESRAPNLAECRSFPESEAVLLIQVTEFETTTFHCVRDADGRYGYIEPLEVEYSDGEPYEYYFYYVIWKMPGDELDDDD